MMSAPNEIAVNELKRNCEQLAKTADSAANAKSELNDLGLIASNENFYDLIQSLRALKALGGFVSSEELSKTRDEIEQLETKRKLLTEFRTLSDLFGNASPEEPVPNR